MEVRRWVYPLVALALYGCGDGPSAPSDAAVTITAAGGTVQSADGKVTLVIPAGALAEPTAITIRSAPARMDARLVPGSEYTFEPNGLHFAVPAHLTIRLDSVPAAFADQADYVWLHRRGSGDWTAVAGEPINRAAPSVSGSIDGFSSYGGVISQLAAELLLAAQQLDAMLTDAIPQNAIALIQTIAGLLLHELDPDFPLAEITLAAIQSTACNAYASAVGNARDAPVDDWAVFTALLEPVYAWSAVAAEAGALSGCPNAPLTVEQIQDLKIQQFVNFYISHLSPASLGQDFEKLLDEVRFVYELRGTVQVLGLTSADQRLLDDAQYPLMRELRVSAYSACRSNGEHKYLGGLRAIVDFSDYTDEELITDLQQCATRLMWSVSSQDGQVNEQGSLGGGPNPGSEVVEAASPGVAKGTFALSGDVRAFRCPDGSYGDDALIVTLDGVEVHRRQASGGAFFASPLVLDAETVLAAAGVDPTQTATVPLVAARESQGCGQYVQVVAPIPLATLRLGYPPPFTYFNDFSSAAGPEWSTQDIDVTPNGERYLGQFINASAVLRLDDLPAHAKVVVEFDLYCIKSWDGNTTGTISDEGEAEGPDIIRVVIGGTPVLVTTFANVDAEQAYPGQYPGSSYPPGTGAAASNSLGYDDDDSTYHLVFEVTHSSASLAVVVTGQGLQTSPDDEWWGIDNVRVTTR